MASSLDCCCQLSLMLCAVSCDSSRKDLATLGDISLKLLDILVADCVILVATEYANLSSSAESAFSSVSAFIISLKSHFISPFKSSFAHHVNGSSSLMPSGIFINPSAEVSGSDVRGALPDEAGALFPPAGA